MCLKQEFRGRVMLDELIFTLCLIIVLPFFLLKIKEEYRDQSH